MGGGGEGRGSAGVGALRRRPPSPFPGHSREEAGEHFLLAPAGGTRPRGSARVSGEEEEGGDPAPCAPGDVCDNKIKSGPAPWARYFF